MHPFKVGQQYTRGDVFDVLGLGPHPVSGDWFTGYAHHDGDRFICCSVGTSGRSGHDYGNRFIEGRLHWRGKTGSRTFDPSIRKLLQPARATYIFYREDDRSAVTFAGVGLPVEVRDTVPVEVTWILSPNFGPVPDALLEEVEGGKTVLEAVLPVDRRTSRCMIACSFLGATWIFPVRGVAALLSATRGMRRLRQERAGCRAVGASGVSIHGGLRGAGSRAVPRLSGAPSGSAAAQ